MENFLKKYWKTILLFMLAGLIGGFLVGLFLMDSYPAEIRQQIYDQGLNDVLLGLITALQSVGYALVLGVAGILLSKKTGMWKDERQTTWQPLVAATIVALMGGLAMILLDIFWFGPASQVIMDSYATKPSIAFVLGSVIYGGVIEEVMLRLFMMSLIAFLLHKIFWRKREQTPVAALVAANVLSALLFAVGHLPTTAILLGLSPMILLRCFLLNGGIGLLFGWLYRKYGLRYAMIAHGGCHIVSKLIWILFI